MKEMNKLFIKLTTLLLVFNLVFWGPASLVLAQEASPSPSSETTAQNSNTGSTSDNTSTTTTTDTADTTNNNDASVNNTTTGGSDSGSNTSTDNTGDATIDTSGATTTSGTQTTVNTNYYEPMPWTTWTGEGDWQSRAANSNTGSASTNTATTDTAQTDNLTNINTADVNNTSNTGSSTGENIASDNTGNAGIYTGNASTTQSTQNVVNTNYWTGDGDWTNFWNGEALNWRTGSNSTNTSSAELDRIISVLNQNGVDVDNLIHSFATSGNNSASDNTGNASITTGNASVLSTLFNLANTNIFGTDAINILYQDIYGSYNQNINLAGGNLLNLPSHISSGNANASNNTTGFNSDNISEVMGSLTVDITNNNNGDLLNDLDLAAISGNNSASDNTGSSYIETGDADIIANLINFLNTNIFTNEFYLGVINVYGDWNGNLILPQYADSGNNLASGGFSATNEFTGSVSTNNSDITLDSNFNLDNNNLGNVINDFDVTSETGGNSADDNTLNGFVQSGQAGAEANLATYANTNVVSDTPWWLILVNNMGTWIPVLMPLYSGSTQLVMDLDDLNTEGSYSYGAGGTGASNELTGSLSENNADVSLNSDVNITNNNDGTIINNVNALALTGNNEADRNTGNGTVITGDANVWINALNFLNTNIIAPSVLLTVVNIFGSWTGDILDSEADAPIPQYSDNNAAQAPQGGTGSSGGGSSTGSNNLNTQTQNAVAESNSGPIQTSFVSFAASNFGGSNSSAGQVLAFFEEKDAPAGQAIDQAFGSNSNFADAFKTWMLLLGLLPVLISVAFWQRNRVLKVIKKRSFSNLQ